MTNAYIYSKGAEGTVGLVHSFKTEPEAWAWVRTQDTDGRNVVVATDGDIGYAWRLFGANREDDDEYAQRGTPEDGAVSGADGGTDK